MPCPIALGNLCGQPGGVRLNCLKADFTLVLGNGPNKSDHSVPPQVYQTPEENVYPSSSVPITNNFPSPELLECLKPTSLKEQGHFQVNFHWACLLALTEDRLPREIMTRPRTRQVE